MFRLTWTYDSDICHVVDSFTTFNFYFFSTHWSHLETIAPSWYICTLTCNRYTVITLIIQLLLSSEQADNQIMQGCGITMADLSNLSPFPEDKYKEISIYCPRTRTS